MADSLDFILGTIRDKLLVSKVVIKSERDQHLPKYIIDMKIKLKNIYRRAKQTKNAALMLRSRKYEKIVRREINANKDNRVKIEANLGPNNLWKAVKIALDKPLTKLPKTIKSGDAVAKTDKEKADAFATYFDNKIKMIRASNKPKTHVYNGKKKIHNNYNDNWVTKDIVNKVMAELKPKCCQGYDRIPLVFLS